MARWRRERVACVPPNRRVSSVVDVQRAPSLDGRRARSVVVSGVPEAVRLRARAATRERKSRQRMSTQSGRSTRSPLPPRRCAEVSAQNIGRVEHYPPEPGGVAATISAATSVVEPKPIAMRRPVNISGKAVIRFGIDEAAKLVVISCTRGHRAREPGRHHREARAKKSASFSTRDLVTPEPSRAPAPLRCRRVENPNSGIGTSCERLAANTPGMERVSSGDPLLVKLTRPVPTIPALQITLLANAAYVAARNARQSKIEAGAQEHELSS